MLVLMNKDNAEGLRRCLETLASQEECRLCECFDVLVMDGHSRDGSDKVVEEFSKRYGCVKLVKQAVRGGVGPARAEVVRYAKERGYRYIIWGDSENTYTPKYVYSLIKCVDNNHEVFSGFTKVKHTSIWSRIFFWYHAYHMLFSCIRERHAPGNNKLTKITVFNKVMYPPSTRSDDFYFSVLAMKRGVRFRHCPEAEVVVTMPSSFKEVKAWQRSRVKGLVEGAYMIGVGFPPDLPPWAAFALLPLAVVALIIAAVMMHPPMNLVSYSLLGVIALTITWLVVRLESLAIKAYSEPRRFQGILGFLGMYLHALFTTYYSLKYLIKLWSERGKLRARLENVLRHFGFDPSLARLKH